MDEIWKDIPGYEGLYQVSNLGNVRSLNYNKTGEIKLLKPFTSHNGYRIVSLSNNGKLKGYTIHRLVANAFIPNPNNLPQVNHIDENKTNNRTDNLEWCTQAYNNTYGTHTKRVSKSNSIPVAQYDKNGILINTYLGAADAEKHTGFAHQDISKCCRGIKWHKTVGGYIWKYL